MLKKNPPTNKIKNTQKWTKKPINQIQPRQAKLRSWQCSPTKPTSSWKTEDTNIKNCTSGMLCWNLCFTNKKTRVQRVKWITHSYRLIITRIWNYHSGFQAFNFRVFSLDKLPLLIWAYRQLSITKFGSKNMCNNQG